MRYVRFSANILALSILFACTNSSVEWKPAAVGQDPKAAATKVLEFERIVANGYADSIVVEDLTGDLRYQATGAIRLAPEFGPNAFVAQSRGEGALLITDAAGNSVRAPVYVPASGPDLEFGEAGGVATPLMLPLLRSMMMSGSKLLAEQADGKIVVVGALQVPESGTAFGVARYLRDGKLDPAFGTLGVTTIDITSENDFAIAAAIQTDGKIIVVGGSNLDQMGYGAGNSTAIRLLQDGQLDASFASGGIFTRDFSQPYSALISSDSNFIDMLTTVTLQKDGKIVLAGYAQITPIEGLGGVLTNKGTDPMLVRLDTNGKLDASFNDTGYLIGRYGLGDANAASTSSEHVGVEIDSKNRIVVAGYLGGTDCLANYFGKESFVVARYLEDGKPDPSFGDDGRTCVKLTPVTLEDQNDHDDRATSISLQSDGKIVVVGMADYRHPTSGVLRLLENGQRDSGFGTNGIVSFNAGELTLAETVAIQPDGRILLGGGSAFHIPGGDDLGAQAMAALCAPAGWKVMRFETNGAVDLSFGESGVWTESTDKPCPTTLDDSELPLLSDRPIRVKSILPKRFPNEKGKLIIAGTRHKPTTTTDDLAFPQIFIRSRWP